MEDYVMICGEKISINETVLSLDGKCNDEWPADLFKLVEMVHLDIRNNNLCVIPSEIKNLTKLTNLNLANNKIRELPSEIQYLKQLMYLNLFGNKLQTIPPEIGALNKLHDLTLDNNELSSLPLEMDYLQGLRSLSIRHNSFNHIPWMVFDLKNLYWIDVSFNNISMIPREIQNLEKLKIMSFYGNPIRELPSQIIELPNTEFSALTALNNKEYLCKLCINIATSPSASGVFIDTTFSARAKPRYHDTCYCIDHLHGTSQFWRYKHFRKKQDNNTCYHRLVFYEKTCYSSDSDSSDCCDDNDE